MKDHVDVLMMMMMLMFWWWWCFDDDDVLMKMLLIERSKCWRCCWSKGQSAEDDVADWKVKVLKMMLLIERSKCWRWCCWSKGQSVEDVVADQKVKVLKMLMLFKELLTLKIEDKDYIMLKGFQWFIDVLPWWCWWRSLSLSYYCCCWCCCRIPFSLRGSVEILWLRRIFYMYLFVVLDGPTGRTTCITLPLCS